jgi:hypothetical protein
MLPNNCLDVIVPESLAQTSRQSVDEVSFHNVSPHGVFDEKPTCLYPVRSASLQFNEWGEIIGRLYLLKNTKLPQSTVWHNRETLSTFSEILCSM